MGERLQSRMNVINSYAITSMGEFFPINSYVINSICDIYFDYIIFLFVINSIGEFKWEKII
jgi:hypothetical protein